MRLQLSWFALVFLAISGVSATYNQDDDDDGYFYDYYGHDNGNHYGHDNGNHYGHDNGNHNGNDDSNSDGNDDSNSDGNDGGNSDGNGNGNSGGNDVPQVVECPLNWEYRCVLDLQRIHPKKGTAKQFCDGVDGYVVDEECHIEPGPLIESNQCCRFG